MGASLAFLEQSGYRGRGGRDPDEGGLSPDMYPQGTLTLGWGARAAAAQPAR